MRAVTPYSHWCDGFGWWQNAGSCGVHGIGEKLAYQLTQFIDIAYGIVSCRRGRNRHDQKYRRHFDTVCGQSSQEVASSSGEAVGLLHMPWVAMTFKNGAAGYAALVTLIQIRRGLRVHQQGPCGVVVEGQRVSLAPVH